MTDPEQSPKQYRKVINSWVMYDWANSAFATTVMAAILPVYYSKVAGATLNGNKPTFYWGYTVSIALLITAFLSPIMGAISDYTGAKKRFLMMFAAIGIFFSAGAILLSRVDVKRGIHRAREEDMNAKILLSEN